MLAVPAVQLRAFTGVSCSRSTCPLSVAFLHRLGTIVVMTTIEQPLRVPVTEASKRGVSWLNETAASRRVLLTRFGRIDSVVDSPDRLDKVASEVADARREVVESFAEVALTRSQHHSLAEVCARLDIDPQKVRARAQQLRPTP